jgi:hypothetical protein
MKTFVAMTFVAATLCGQSVASETGAVVLEDTPGCDEFVVETSLGYVLLEWYGGVVSIWEGDTVVGDLHSYGFTDVHIDGRGEMRVWVEDYMVGEREATEYFYSACD